METPIQMSSPDAAKSLGIATYTLRAWRMKGTGPQYTKIGGRAYYAMTDLDAWVASHPRYRNTAEAAVAKAKAQKTAEVPKAPNAEVKKKK